MFRLFNFRFDIISLITGFLISTFFWWLSTIFKGWFPKLKALIINKVKVARDRNFSGIDAILRQTTFRRAQHMHLAQAIFPLDEILIIPQVLAPPVSIVNPETLSQTETIADQVIPYIPDWPELSAQYSVARLKLHQVIKYGANIAIIGQPGSGKTVALAYLACQICRRDPQIEEFSSAVPLFVHFLDIDTSADDDPFDCLVTSVSKQFPRLAQSRLPTFLRTGLKEGRIILMLDGLDELPSPNLSVAVAYIEKLKKNYPQIQLIVSGSPDCFDGLAKMGFFPLTIAAWSQTERQQFISNWRKLWTDEFVPKTSGQNGQEFFYPLMVENWLDTINPYLNPFELTITVWGAFSADLNGLTVPDAIESYLKRMAAGIPHSALENLGMSILEETQPSLSYVQFEKALGEHAKTGTSPMTSQPSQPALASSASSSQAIPARSSKKSDSTVSSRNQILSILVENGILIDCAQEQVRFVNPLISGYLASFKVQEDQVDISVGKLLWVHLIATLHFMAWQNKTGFWLDNFLNQDIPPLHNNLLTVGRWLRDCSSNSLWKPQVMRKLVDLIYEESLPIFIKSRILTAFILSNDPSLPLLFKQMGQSSTPDLRLLSTLGNGAIRNTKALEDLQAMCSDSDAICKNASVLAIAAVDTEKSLEILANTLLNGDEQLRQAAAEAFSQKPPSGHEVLKEAITLEDILVRRAAVYGLALIRENWSKNILEKTAVQDNQWVVRNIAGQALENMQLPHPNIPKRITPPSETDWILKFAGKQGVGIAPGNTVTDILLKVLKSGTNEEKLGALIYLSKTSDEGIIRSILEVAYTQEGILCQAALYSLWYLSISGAAMPDPVKYGYSF